MLGFAFKADTGDTRESPAISLVRDFLSERAFVTIYDPQVDEAQIWLDLSEACPATPLETSTSSAIYHSIYTNTKMTPIFDYLVKKQVTIVHSALEACKNKEAVVIATEWKEFREIDWVSVYEHMNKPAFVFDGRLLVDADKLRQIGFKVRLFFFQMACVLHWSTSA